MKVLFCHEQHRHAQVAVLVSLYNYAHYIGEALDSVTDQTLEDIELVVCNDCSTDNGAAVTLDWMHQHKNRFSRLALIENHVNSGLAATRNQSICYSLAPYIFILDADNLIYPACLERSLEIIAESDPEAAFVYTQREMFNAEDPADCGIENLLDWDPEVITYGNYIDAMVLHKRAALEAVGCYRTDEYFGRIGWEDFEVWYKYVKAGFYGIKIHQPLIRYRFHKNSMMRTITNHQKNQKILWARLRELYPDLCLKREEDI